MRLAVGDVRGKGLGAVEAVAVVLGAFREAAETEPTLEALAQRLERALAREGTRRDSLDAVEGFTTCVLGEIPPGAGTLRLLNRGHPEPLLLHGNGELAVLAPTEPALPLGLGELGGRPDLVQEWAFPAGTTLLLYTDGLTEARDGAGSSTIRRPGCAGGSFPVRRRCSARSAVTSAGIRAAGRRTTWRCWRWVGRGNGSRSGGGPCRWCRAAT